MAAPRNLLELRPARLADWEAGADGLVVIRVPKFTGRIGRWLMPRLRRPFVRVKLDREGSFFWQLCDGATPVVDIALRMHQELGTPEEALHERVSAFIARLERGGLIATSRAQA